MAVNHSNVIVAIVLPLSYKISAAPEGRAYFSPCCDDLSRKKISLMESSRFFKKIRPLFFPCFIPRSKQEYYCLKMCPVSAPIRPRPDWHSRGTVALRSRIWVIFPSPPGLHLVCAALIALCVCCSTETTPPSPWTTPSVSVGGYRQPHFARSPS